MIAFNRRQKKILSWLSIVSSPEKFIRHATHEAYLIGFLDDIKDPPGKPMKIATERSESYIDLQLGLVRWAYYNSGGDLGEIMDLLEKARVFEFTPGTFHFLTKKVKQVRAEGLKRKPNFKRDIEIFNFIRETRPGGCNKNSDNLNLLTETVKEKAAIEFDIDPDAVSKAYMRIIKPYGRIRAQDFADLTKFAAEEKIKLNQLLMK